MISPKHLVNPSFHAAAFEVNFRKASANLPKAGWSKHLLPKVRRIFAKAAASKVFARNADRQTEAVQQTIEDIDGRTTGSAATIGCQRA